MLQRMLEHMKYAKWHICVQRVVYFCYMHLELGPHEQGVCDMEDPSSATHNRMRSHQMLPNPLMNLRVGPILLHDLHKVWENGHQVYTITCVYVVLFSSFSLYFFWKVMTKEYMITTVKMCIVKECLQDNHQTSTAHLSLKKATFYRVPKPAATWSWMATWG